ncbi:MAG: hydratase [Lachnospiraceae bacterium]|nr:hydratase [Lachnospiraceae bacterium]
MTEAIKINRGGGYLINGTEISLKDGSNAPSGAGSFDQKDAINGTIAYSILTSHNKSGDDSKLNIKFDCLTSHDITYVGIIQTARASGLNHFPIPYVLTNCHNSLCAVGGTINEDDHVFGLSAAKKYGGVYVPPHQAVIHQYAREMLAGCGKMILGSDSHTRYGALGTMAIGEGGPELVKQLLGQTYDIDYPEVAAIYLTGEPVPGVGPQDVALAIIGAVFKDGIVKNKVMEFVGPGIANLSADFRIGIDVMTTETTCLSSIWQTDEIIQEFYEIHGRESEYKELKPKNTAYYDEIICVNLSEIKPMIAMPFHPSNAYTIEEVNKNLADILNIVEKDARVSFGSKVDFDLHSKIKDGRLLTDQGIIAGCAGGGFENICAAADILESSDIGFDAFTLSVYPASMPIYAELVKNKSVSKLIDSGAVIKTCFCGPCFGAGDTPANGAFSIRHSTRNFPNREGSKVQQGQIASVALMDARSIAATAANKGYLTAATDVLNIEGKVKPHKYFFDSEIYKKRVFDSKNKPQSDEELILGPNIKDWPKMCSLTDNLLLRVVSEIHDPVTTTDELIPSGETSSYRSNPLGLAEFTLSRKDPEYVGRAKAVKEIEEIREQDIETNNNSIQSRIDEDPELKQAWTLILSRFPETDFKNTGIGSTIFAIKPGDGSAREQAASCQKVLGGWANIAHEYATKRYRSNLINWGMLPFVIKDKDLPFKNLDYIFIPEIKSAIENVQENIKAFVVHQNELKEFSLSLGQLTQNERQIILDGCLINYNRPK